MHIKSPSHQYGFTSYFSVILARLIIQLVANRKYAKNVFG
jgi:hypothetical protein